MQVRAGSDAGSISPGFRLAAQALEVWIGFDSRWPHLSKPSCVWNRLDAARSEMLGTDLRDASFFSGDQARS